MIYCVDLDGTLIKNDMSVTSFWYCFRHNPFIIFLCMYWYFCGRRSLLKLELSKRFKFEVSKLNYNKNLISWLEELHSCNNDIYLVSGSTNEIVKTIADYFPFFSGCYGSSKDINLTGYNKMNFLKVNFNKYEDICYVGNSRVDLKVWEGTKFAAVVSDNESFIKEASSKSNVIKVFRNSWV